MSNYSTTKMSSKGQVVIPEEIRLKLGLEAGTQFVVVGSNDVVILKTITPPSIDKFDELLSEAQKQAKTAGIKPSDITKIIKKIRKQK